MKFSQRFTPNKTFGNFVACLTQQRSLFYLLNMTFNDRTAWYVFEVDPNKQKLFDSQFAPGIDMELSDFGTVHYKGWGAEPPQSLKIELSYRFGLFDN